MQKPIASELLLKRKGDASRFEALLVEYQKAPRVTRDRLYIEAVEAVYGESAKVLIDTEGSGNLLYLPLDEIMNRSGINMPSIENRQPAECSSTGSAG